METVKILKNIEKDMIKNFFKNSLVAMKKFHDDLF